MTGEGLDTTGRQIEDSCSFTFLNVVENSEIWSLILFESAPQGCISLFHPFTYLTYFAHIYKNLFLSVNDTKIQILMHYNIFCPCLQFIFGRVIHNIDKTLIVALKRTFGD